MAPPPSAAVSAPPSTAAISPVVALLVRILTFICLLISLIILATNTATLISGDIEVEFTPTTFYAYRYMLAVTVIGIAYTLLQTAFSISQVRTGNRIGSEGLLQLDFYGDKGISYLLATGASAGFALTVELNRSPGKNSATKDYLSRGNAAASLLLLGFFVLCSIMCLLIFLSSKEELNTFADSDNNADARYRGFGHRHLVHKKQDLQRN